MDNSIKTKIAASLLSISAAGIYFIQASETGENKPSPTVAFKDPVGIPTICDGITKGVTMGMKVTPQQCQVMLKEELSEKGKQIGKLIKVPISQSQYDAVLSFSYNIGVGAFAKSTLLHKINDNRCEEAGKEFLKWDKAKKNGKVVTLKGLTIRRQKESEMWLSGCDKK